MASFGIHTSIDLATDSIRAALISQNQEIEYLTKIPIKLPPHIFNSQSVLNQYQETFLKYIKQLDVPTPKVSYTVPEDTVFTQLIVIPNVPEEEIPEALYWKLQNLLPRSIETYTKDFIIVSKNEKEIVALTYALPTYIIQFFGKIFEQLELEPVLIEPRSIALHRIVAQNTKQLKGAFLIVDITYEGTSITIATNEKVFYTQTLPIGVNTVIEKLQITLNAPRDEVLEKLKQRKIPKEKILETTNDIASKINTEFVRLSTFIREKTKMNPTIVALFYNTSEFYLVEHFKLSLLSSFSKEIKVALINPFNLLKIPADFPRELLTTDLAAAIGLNLRKE